MKIKTNILSGEALNYAATLADKGNASIFIAHTGVFHTIFSNEENGYIVFPNYLNWSDAGPIIDREITRLFKNVAGGRTAQIRHEKDHPLVARKVTTGWTSVSGPTSLIAAMRCFVASRLGDEVEIPDVLCNSYV